MLRKLLCATSVMALAMCVGVSAQAKTISINFSGASPTGDVGVAETAGVIAVGNWNNISNATGGTAASLPLVDSTGAATGVTLSFSGQNGFDSQASSGGNAGDNNMMNYGLRSIDSGGAATDRNVTQVLLEGLSADFGGAYDVYIYYNNPSFGFMYGGGTLYESSDTADYTVPTTTPTMPTASVTQSAAYSTPNGSSYTGTYTEGVNYAKFTGTTLADAVYTFSQATGGPGGTFNASLLTGIQIDGGAVVPEPSTMVLAGIGLVGLVGFGLRRRKK